MTRTLTIYYIKKSDWRKSFNSLSDDELDDVLSGKKVTTHRRGVASLFAALYNIDEGTGMKVGVSKGEKMKTKFNSLLAEAISAVYENMEDSRDMVIKMADVHTIAGLAQVIEAFAITSKNKRYGGYFITYT